MRAFKILFACLFFIVLSQSCTKEINPEASFKGFEAPLNFPLVHYNFTINPVNKAGFDLGKKLFYDGILSRDGSISCGSCHQQAAAFAHFDHTISHGIDDKIGNRNAPVIQNTAWQQYFAWDGGIFHLDDFPINPITNPVEMDEKMPQVLSKLNANSTYRTMFKKAFNNDEDIHSLTASQVFNVDIKKVDQDMRRKAKAINFGIIYGISQYGLAKQINVSNHEANEFLEAYFAKFPEIKVYMDDTIKFCRKSGYVNNVFGRRSHFNGINDKNFNVRNFQERAAINAPIQGSASEIMRLAMIRIDQKFKEMKNNKSKILLQIHDELIFEVPEKEAKNITKIIKEEMTSVTNSDLHAFSIPLTVDINTGDNWGVLH